MVFEIFLRCGTQAPEANCTWFRMMPGVNTGFLVPLGALAAPIDDTIGPVARLRVFRGRLSIPKVIARWFSKSSWGAGLRLLEQIAHDFAWCQESMRNHVQFAPGAWVPHLKKISKTILLSPLVCLGDGGGQGMAGSGNGRVSAGETSWSLT